MANTPKKNRADLKSVFKNGSQPSESDFADLIDGMLNQADDGIIKSADKPLQINAVGDAAGVQPVINFFDLSQINPENPSWSLQLNPKNPSDGTNKLGFCIADGLGNPRLIIKEPTENESIGTINLGSSLDVKVSGYIKLGLEGNGGGQLILTNDPGIDKIYLEAFSTNGQGTTTELLLTGKATANVPAITLKADTTNLMGKTNITGNTCIGFAKIANPIAMLDIAQAARSGTQPAAINGLYVTGDFKDDSNGVEFRNSDAKQGIGFGNNTIYAAGFNASQDLNLKAKGTGAVQILGIANISDIVGVALTNFNTNSSMIAGSLTIGSNTKSYGGTDNTAGLLMTTSSNTEIAVNQSGKRLASLMYYESSGSPPNKIINNITIGRDMGSGYGSTPVTIANNLNVEGTAEGATINLGTATIHTDTDGSLNLNSQNVSDSVITNCGLIVHGKINTTGGITINGEIAVTNGGIIADGDLKATNIYGNLCSQDGNYQLKVYNTKILVLTDSNGNWIWQYPPPAK